MILVDYQINELCNEGLVTPCDRSLINPASLDVRIGNSAIVEYLFGDKPEWANLDLSQYSIEAPYWLQPKEFILVATLEQFNMPNNVAGEFKLKSSRARSGYNNCLAVYLDPGWHGSVLTLELINECRYTRLPLYPGLKIGQIVFHSCSVPHHPYGETGRYNGAKTVEASKG